jgi:hypothetical protein
MNSAGTGWFERPQPTRTSPKRNAANYFRSVASGRRAIGGIRLDSTEAAVVAAVRIAYNVAEAQIDRSVRLARRLRKAGDQATGGRSDKQALDATEQLVFKAIMAFLGWLEGAASESGNPLQRLAAAQYRIVGSVLGLTPPEASAKAKGRPPGRPDAPARAKAPSGKEEPRRGPVRIQHTGTERRAVRVSAWEYEGSPRQTMPVTFYHVDGAGETLEGQIAVVGRQSVALTLATPRSAPAGRWRAALCDAEGVQVGRIEITL